MVQGEWGVGVFLDSLIEDETRPPECLRFGHCLFVHRLLRVWPSTSFEPDLSRVWK